MTSTFAKLVLPLALFAAGAPAAAQDLGAGAQVSISYAANGGIRDWYAQDERAIYLRDRTGRWYYASFVGVCPNLLQSTTVGFETDPLGRFTTSSAVHTRDGRCVVDSVVRTAAPPEKGS